MNKFLLSRVCLILLAVAFYNLSSNSVFAQIDPDASEKTRLLYQNLKQIQNSDNFMFGQEFYNSFRYSSGAAHGTNTFSDSKEVTGAHPALLGSDFHYYLDKDATERGFHTEAVKSAYQQGAVITFDWHLSGRGTTTYEYQEASKNLANNIVQNLNGDRDWYFGELDKAIGIVNNDLVVDGERIPIIFRPLHEMNGGWFWWGSQATTAENYKALYKLTVDYITERTTSVLFCWSPNIPTNMTYFPGNEYVDVLGLDGYEFTAASLRSNIAPLVDHAKAHGKVAVIAETGNRTNGGASPGDDAANYWKNTMLPAIMDDPNGKAKRIAWVLTWINSSWSFPYVPHAGSSQTAKQSFIDFKNSSNTLFLDEIPNMYIENEVVLATDESLIPKAEKLQIYPTPSRETLTVLLDGFQNNAQIAIYDLNGKKLYEDSLDQKETEINIASFLKPGFYVLKVSDSKNSVSRRILVDE